MDQTYINDLVTKAAEFGEGKIHIIVNNAGYTWDGVIHKMSDEQWDTIINLHGKSPFQLIRAAAPYFRVKDGQQRNIIGVSSTSGDHGNAGQINYALVKAGVSGMIKTIAKEWGPQFNVRANAIAFGRSVPDSPRQKRRAHSSLALMGRRLSLECQEGRTLQLQSTTTSR
jgi:3-oxoacyl-[acyl-carrier protein] reductase